jgi:branched-subunit amino acid ABC-type transport system permease component
VASLLPHVVNGLSLGLLFALIALGFMLIVGVMEVINLAHGSLFALGAYVALFMLGPAATPLGYAMALVFAPGGGRGVRHAARALPAPHLRQGSALRAAAHLRGSAGDRGADPRGRGARASACCPFPRRSPARC